MKKLLFLLLTLCFPQLCFSFTYMMVGANLSGTCSGTTYAYPCAAGCTYGFHLETSTDGAAFTNLNGTGNSDYTAPGCIAFNAIPFIYQGVYYVVYATGTTNVNIVSSTNGLNWSTVAINVLATGAVANGQLLVNNINVVADASNIIHITSWDGSGANWRGTNSGWWDIHASNTNLATATWSTPSHFTDVYGDNLPGLTRSGDNFTISYYNGIYYMISNYPSFYLRTSSNFLTGWSTPKSISTPWPNGYSGEVTTSFFLGTTLRMYDRPSEYASAISPYTTFGSTTRVTPTRYWPSVMPSSDLYNNATTKGSSSY